MADLLSIPAAAYDAVKDRTLRRLLREIQEAHAQKRAVNRASLMADFKRRMGRA